MQNCLAAVTFNGVEVVIPEIADYGVRRELLVRWGGSLPMTLLGRRHDPGRKPRLSLNRASAHSFRRRRRKRRNGI